MQYAAHATRPQSASVTSVDLSSCYIKQSPSGLSFLLSFLFSEGLLAMAGRSGADEYRQHSSEPHRHLDSVGGNDVSKPFWWGVGAAVFR